MTCPNCNKEMPEGSLYCSYCGTSFENEGALREMDTVVRGDTCGGRKEALLSVVAYIFAIIGSTLSATALFLFVILEGDCKNQSMWLKKQCAQALLLCVMPDMVSSILKAFNVFSYIPLIRAITGTSINILIAVVSAVCIVCAIIGICKSMDKKDLTLPVIGKFVEKYLK